MSTINSLENHHQGAFLSPPLNFDLHEEDENQADKPSKGKTLDEIFSQNSAPPQEDTTQSIGFFQRMLNFFKSQEAKEASRITEKKQEPSAINFTPVIDEPDQFDPRLLKHKILKPIDLSPNLSNKQIYEGLSRMSPATAREVMVIVLAAQQELAREGALLHIDDLERFQKTQKLQRQILKEITEALKHDEAVSGYFKTAQNISMAAGVLTTVAATIATLFGYEIPFTEIIQLSAAVSTALSTAGKSYFDVRSDEDKAKFTNVEHDTKMRKRNIENSTERLEKCTQTDIDKQCSKLLKDIVEMSKMINS